MSITYLSNAPVKLFKNVCDQKGRGTRKKGDFSDYIGRGKEKIM